MQQRLYYQHLSAQFQDRATYWRERGQARSKGLDILWIQDGVDQNKMLLPRSKLMKAKCFESMQRPKLALTAVICHGHHIGLYISEMTVPKDSNSSFELIAKTLQHLHDEGVHLPSCRITCQADNTSREVKNGIVARGLAAMVSDNLVAEARMSFLRTGHSHEDVDQLFSQVSDWLNRHLRHAENTEDVMDCLRQFLDHLDRPFEPRRFLHKVDVTRNWLLRQIELAFRGQR